MYIVADIGGTKTRIAKCANLESFDEPIIVDTPHEYAAGLDLFVQTVRSITTDPIESVAIGITGVRSADKRTVVTNRHPDWENRTLAADLESALGTNVVLENDAALVGLGEAVSGAGAGAAIVAYVTVSTGVNGARITNGEIDPTTIGFEIGGQYLAMRPPQTLEDLVSGTAVSEKYGVPPKELGKESQVWNELALYLAHGLCNTIVHWSPERVVLGGSMFNEIGISIDRVRGHVAALLEIYPAAPEIVHSGLGEVGGLYGGLALLKKHHR